MIASGLSAFEIARNAAGELMRSCFPCLFSMLGMPFPMMCSSGMGSVDLR